jgi:hypothetical protein
VAAAVSAHRAATSVSIRLSSGSDSSTPAPGDGRQLQARPLLLGLVAGGLLERIAAIALMR